MNDSFDFERYLADRFDEVAQRRRPAPSLDPILTQASRKRPLPRWLADLKEPPMRFRSRVAVGSPTRRLTMGLALAALSVLALAGIVIAGASPAPSPMPIAPVPPTWITGTVLRASSCSGSETSIDPGVRHEWNTECSPQTWTSSDPRLTGPVARRWNEDIYETDAGTYTVSMDAAYLQNDGGSWACTDSRLLEGSGSGSTAVTGGNFTCVGEGGYAGLSAIVVLEPSVGFNEDLVGLIFSGELPPMPGPPAAK